MSARTTTEVIELFNRAFVEHEPALLTDLIAEDCVMEAIRPAPSGERVVGREACAAWWSALADDHGTQFAPHDVFVADDRATIMWDYRFGDGPNDWVRGVNVMRVMNGRIVEALGFSKIAGDVPLATDTASADDA